MKVTAPFRLLLRLQARICSGSKPSRRGASGASRVLPWFALASLLLCAVHQAPAQCIILECPTNQVVECETPTGAWVDFTVIATGLCSTNLTLTCDPMPQTVFPPGTNVVSCEAYDDLGNTNTCTFEVVVRDTTPPQILAPDLLVTPCENASGAIVTFAVAGVDACDTNVLISCVPASGSLFPIGTNTVNCSATDADGNTAFHSFAVVVTGACSQNPCITILSPTNILTNCTGTGGTPVSFNLQATNVCGPNPPVNYDPPSGSLFPPGITTVYCEATDPTGGGTAFATFTVEVIDEVPPTLTCPSNMVVEAQGLAGAMAGWTLTAMDNCDTNVTIYSDPPSGSVFPLGESQVIGWARDASGNIDSCGFTITVTNLHPFRIDRSGSNNVLLTWRGNDTPQEATALLPPIPWVDVGGTIVTNGSELTLLLPASGSNRFFRLRSNPLGTPPDTDGDGVPDSIDKCAETPVGAPVDACGCSLLELVRCPEQVTGNSARFLSDALTRIEGVPEFSGIASELTLYQQAMAEAQQSIRAGAITDGVNAYTQAVAGIELELTNLQALIAQLAAVLMAEPSAVPLDDGDTRPQDALVDTYLLMEDALADSFSAATNAASSLLALQGAITGATSLSADVQALDDASRTIQLDSGMSVGLLEKDYGSAITVGGAYTLDLLTFSDGTAVAQGIVGQVGSPPFLLDAIPAKCLSLRFAPVQPFPPHSFGPYLLHAPVAYWFNGEYWIERGTRFAVDGNCPPSITTVSNTTISYRMRLDLRYFQTNKNVSTTKMIAGGLIPGATPVRMPVDLDSSLPATLEAHLLRYECDPLGGGLTFCGQPDVVCITSYKLRIRELNHYASASYDETAFSMKDAPKGFTSEWRTNRADGIQTTEVFGFSSLGFRAVGYRVQGGQSSYPTLKTVALNQDFAVRYHDFFDLFTEFNGNPFPRWGTFTRSALAWPRLTGTRNGRSFSYSCVVPGLVRDVVSFCGPVRSDYRLPFVGGWPVWTMGQGNNGSFTHSGSSAYAFDMKAPVGTPIHAARGGIVEAIRESIASDSNCYDASIKDCTNCASPSANRILIQHQDGTYAVYFHMPQNGVFVVPDQQVYRGDQIGIVGNTGCSSIPHLHFEARGPDNGQSIPSSFEAFEVCVVFGETNACTNTKTCYIPVKPDKLFSTNKRWNQ